MMPLSSAIGRELRLAVIDNAIQGWRGHFSPPARLELRDGGIVVAMVHWDARKEPVGTTLDGTWRFEATGWWYWRSQRTIPTVVRSVTSKPAEVARFLPAGILGWLSFPDIGRLVLPDGFSFDWTCPRWSSRDADLVRFFFDGAHGMTCTVEQRAMDEPALPVLVTLGMYLWHRGMLDL